MRLFAKQCSALLWLHQADRGGSQVRPHDLFVFDLRRTVAGALTEAMLLDRSDQCAKLPAPLPHDPE